MKTLGIDLRCLPTDGTAGGGVAHGTRAVTKEIVRVLGGNVILYLPMGALLDERGDATTVILPDARRAALVDALKKSPCDKLFVPSGAVPVRLPVPAVPWVHDCDIFDHPEWFPQSWLKRQLTTRMFLNGLRRAPHVFASSEYTKSAVERLVPSARGHITVTGEGGGDAELATIRIDQLPAMKLTARSRVASLGATRRFVLMLGTLEPRKNIPLICRIWPEVAKAVPGVDLVIAGQDGWKIEAIHAAIEECKHLLKLFDSRVVLLQRTRDEGRLEFSEQDRHNLTLGADVVCVPSFSEGFGLVALDAIQAGTPVLTSNRGALPEVTGEQGMDPTDDQRWKDALIETLSNPAIREGIIARQSPRRDAFSWKKTAHIFLEHLNA